MDLDLHQVLVRVEIVVAQLDVRVDSHPSSPNVDLVLISQRHAMVVSEADILDELRSTI